MSFSDLVRLGGRAFVPETIVFATGPRVAPKAGLVEFQALREASYGRPAVVRAGPPRGAVEWRLP